MVEPFGQVRQDWMLGEVASDNRNLWASAGSEKSTPFDYMPGYEPPEPTEEEIAELAVAFARGMRGE